VNTHGSSCRLTGFLARGVETGSEEEG
jgi:hypothetical protein